MDLIRRLMTLVDWLRHPQQKPPVTARADARLDAAERRLDRLMRDADKAMLGRAR